MVLNTRVPTLGPESAYIFRITHVDNVGWILRHGVHCRSSSSFDPNFIAIGSAELIEKRKGRAVPVPPGGMLSDYVPFYFTPWSKMSYNIKTGYAGVTRRANREIAILVSSLPTLVKRKVPFVFTNYHAYTAQADEFFTDLDGLHRVNWPLLRSRDFRNDPENPRKSGEYQAEALVHRCLPLDALLGIACYDAEAHAMLSRAAQQARAATPIKVLPNWYFD